MFLSVVVQGQQIDTTGCYLREPVPVGGCEMRVVTVDAGTQHIWLEWSESEDSRVVGYCICSGSPCLGLDTVWGRENTSYECLQHNSREIHSYCVFAIDSCLHGSALTNPVKNIVMQMESWGCDRRVRLDWNEYQNMLGGVDYYVVEYNIAGTRLLDTVNAATASKQFGEDVMGVKVRVGAVGGEVVSWSNYEEASFPDPDSCWHPQPDPVVRHDTVDFFFPNVFTPDMMTNSKFGPVFPIGKEVEDFEMYIYNRMGLKLFETRDAREQWDGTCNGEKLPTGVYVYLVRYKSGGLQKYTKGTIMIMR